MFNISLEGKTAVVTGGSRGIGRGIAEMLLSAGADVVINYNKTPCQDFVDSATAQNRKALAIQADISTVAGCDSLISETVKTFGKIDILVNNAGITRDTLLMRMSDDDWQAVIDTNLRSVFACCRAAVRPMMKARSGSIINISSISGIMGLAGQTNYSASKAGVIGLSKALAREVASRGIRVNVIAPGFVKSDMTNAMDDKVREKVLGEIPLGMLGEPSDIAGAALYLASPLSRFVTGSVLVVDGGMAM